MWGEEEVAAGGARGKGWREGSRLPAASNLGQPSLAWRGHSSSGLLSCYPAHGHTQAKQMEPLEGVFWGPIRSWSSFPVLRLDFFLIVVRRGKAWFVASRGAHCCFLHPCPAPHTHLKLSSCQHPGERSHSRCC